MKVVHKCELCLHFVVIICRNFFYWEILHILFESWKALHPWLLGESWIENVTVKKLAMCHFWNLFVVVLLLLYQSVNISLSQSVSVA